MNIDKKFLPMAKVLADFENDCKKLGSKKLAICVERNDNLKQTYKFDILKEQKYNDYNYKIAERIIKSLLWMYGGYKIYINDEYIGNRIKEEYSKGGKREFDSNFMEKVYEKPFEVIITNKVPESFENAKKHNFDLSGYRIGFDAGGSDRKVSAVIDGKSVYSEEILWLPKTNKDPSYHYKEILQSLKTAASHLPKVEAIGVSSAGIYINNQVKAASLFMSVPEEEFNKYVKNIYIDLAKEIGDVPITVANDGDVTALAGAMSLNKNKVLGIAMGTSEAAGYVDGNGCIKGWLNEFAFAPVDFNTDTIIDPWSGDIGCGVNYFSQDGVIKLADMCGINLDEYETPAKKLKAVQKMLDEGNTKAKEIFEDIGTYLAHSVAYYLKFYDVEYMLILGRVSSGKGGDIMINKCKEVLKKEYPNIAEKLSINLPDEKSRRVGQSIAAASLPIL